MEDKRKNRTEDQRERKPIVMMVKTSGQAGVFFFSSPIRDGCFNPRLIIIITISRECLWRDVSSLISLFSSVAKLPLCVLNVLLMTGLLATLK